jgi:hypothetical protein
MNRRIVVWLLATVFLANVSIAETQQPKKVPRIGYLSPFDASGESARSDVDIAAESDFAGGAVGLGYP